MNESRARRWVAEAAVIVGSILLAFSLDAWWDDRGERARVHELLDAVASEFDAEIAGLDSVIAVNRRVVAAEHALLDLTAPGRPTPDSDTVQALMEAGGIYEIYDPSFGSIAALFSAGGLERIKDLEVRRRIAGWEAELVDLEWERAMVRDANGGVLEGLEGVGSMSSVRTLDDWRQARLEGVLRSAAYRERDSRLSLTVMLFTDDLVRIRRRADEVRAAIRAYLRGES